MMTTEFAVMPSRFLLALTLLLLAPAVQAAELVMFEQKGCVWCQRFDRDIAAAYDKTAEGKRAPLRRVDIDKPQPQDLAFIRRERFTPVFVLVDNGREFGRIRGYPGDAFFWGLLNTMLDRLDRGEPAGPDPNAAPPRGATFGE
jgi:thioredoxin-related protein